MDGTLTMEIESAPGIHVLHHTSGHYWFGGTVLPCIRKDGPDRVYVDGYEEYYYDFPEEPDIKVKCEIHSDGEIRLRVCK